MSELSCSRRTPSPRDPFDQQHGAVSQHANVPADAVCNATTPNVVASSSLDYRNAMSVCQVATQLYQGQ